MLVSERDGGGVVDGAEGKQDCWRGREVKKMEF